MSAFVNRSAQEHLLYLQEKVNPILEALVTAVLLEKPEDPNFFMLKWLLEQTKSLDDATDQNQRNASTAEEIEAVRAEIEKLKARKAELLALKTTGASDGAPTESKPSEATPKPYPASERSTKADDEDEDEDEDDDDDAVDALPVMPPKMNRGPRQSVSAEAYGVWNQRRGDFVAPVHEKSPEQSARIEKCLEGSFLFSALEKEEKRTLVLAFKERVLEPPARIINQGEDGDCMFLIEEGRVDCLKRAEGEEKVVKSCSAGEVFGELALLYNCPRAASVEIKEQTRLWELDRETFNNIVKDAAAKKRATYTEFLQKVPLLCNIDSYEMMTIADALKVESLEAEGSRVIKQGDVGDTFFIILQGECIAKQAFVPGQPEQPVRRHKAGDYFGELALIKNQPRAASVYTAASEVKLLSLDRKTFKRLLGPIEEILRREAKRYDRVST